MSAVLCALGLAMLVTAYAALRHTHTVNRQIPWLDLAVAGSVIAAVGQIGFLMVGRLRVGQLRRHALAMLPSQATADVAAAVTDGLVVVPGGTWVHRPTCLIVTGKAVTVVGGNATRYAACEICGGGQ